jgi:hypothetical protein
LRAIVEWLLPQIGERLFRLSIFNGSLFAHVLWQ